MLNEATGHLDFVLDSLDEESVLRSFEVLNKGGRLVSILTPLTTQLEEKAK